MFFNRLFGSFVMSAVMSDPVLFVFFICSLISMISVFIVCLAVLIDFSEYQKRSDQKREKKSIVETGTMFLFFLLYYVIIRTGAGHVVIESTAMRLILAVIGTI